MYTHTDTHTQEEEPTLIKKKKKGGGKGRKVFLKKPKENILSSLGLLSKPMKGHLVYRC